MTGKVIMVQGTASSVGKSLVSAALCRVFARKGWRVAPYKSQNMSNNAAVVRGAPDGRDGEIGRAQALQAAAAGVEPCVDMNPILLKPETDSRSQVILHGRPWATLGARDYYEERPALWAAATASLDRLRSDYDLVVIEGAGSPAEINLRDTDMANMAVARYANSPVILVGDIDPGGVFAQFVGTLALLLPEERALVKGLVVNKFRGDLSLLEPGLRTLEGLAGLPVLGVLPWLRDVGLAEEDAQPLERRALAAAGAGATAGGAASHGPALDIAVIHYPHIANFDDIDALRLEKGVSLRFVERAEELGYPDAVILPGSKATLADLAWLRERGLDEGIRWLARAGRSVVGLCGGYQMLGRGLADPEGVEGRPSAAPGLGLLPVETTFAAGKHVARLHGSVLGGPGFLASARGAALEGYEIHAGETRRAEAREDGSGPLFALRAASGSAATEDALDGTATRDGRVWGSYLHGIFDLPVFRRAWLDSLAPGHPVRAGAAGTAPGRGQGPGLSLTEAREAALDRLADAAERNLDMEAIARMAGLASTQPRKEHQ